jgi:hypothetical protein
MPTIDLSGAVLQSSSPIIDGGSYSTARPAIAEYSITGPDIGDEPNVVLYRDYSRGEDGEDFIVTPRSGEVGTWNNSGASSNNQAIYKTNADGFPCLLQRDPRKPQQMPLNLTSSEQGEFRLSRCISVLNDSAFAGAGELATEPDTSALKDLWIQYENASGAEPTEADLCVFTAVLSGIKIQGNASRPFGSANTVMLLDWFDFDEWNNCSYYSKNGSPVATVDVGVQQSMFTSKKTGATKSTGTKITDTTNISHGVGSSVDPAKATFSYLASQSYFTIADGEKVTCMAYRSDYWAHGENSFQCLFFANAETIEESTFLCAVKASSWVNNGDGTHTVKATPSAWLRSVSTHMIVLKANNTIQAVELT